MCVGQSVSHPSKRSRSQLHCSIVPSLSLQRERRACEQSFSSVKPPGIGPEHRAECLPILFCGMKPSTARETFSVWKRRRRPFISIPRASRKDSHCYPGTPCFQRCARTVYTEGFERSARPRRDVSEGSTRCFVRGISFSTIRAQLPIFWRHSISSKNVYRLLGDSDNNVEP